MNNYIELWLKRKLNEGRIIKHSDSTKVSKKSVINMPDCDTLVSCVQRSISLVSSVEEYIDMLEGFVSIAADRGSIIIAFPEYNFFDLLGLLPGFKPINAFLNKRAGVSEGGDPGGGSGLMHSFFYAVSKPIQEAVESIMCLLAKKYGIYIYTGSYFIREGNCLYNGGSLISRSGEIIGTQKKLHLTSFEELLGIKRGNNFEIYSLDIGKVCCPVCMDATYYETFKIATNLGCDIAILPIANNEEYNLYRAMRGIWPRVQESYIYGIKPSLNGWLFGLHFTGKAGIFAPIALTNKKNGVVSIAKKHEGDEVVTGCINLAELYRLREEAEYFGDINPVFEKDYYEKTYGGGFEDEKE
ncbi:nitrilase-related carbon-nitrogen hydrolase [Lutispora sp.]|uniref:nitrilase-related carbon-nitrogen hydrolase n=1 Tax=Lutispora sp. TaxID=2828727 RepID=UPI002B220463|nr:nitrilase-related carbon-nitrogen hydrolase [Lutispora sp.]MEA4963776.1 nitrilase-related carbon-nitrogen hydrolase [Lutispora sp.]